MCGRFVFHSQIEEVCQAFEVTHVHQSMAASYNIAPSQSVPTIVAKNEERHFGVLSWGLIPHWTKERKGARRPINARSETVHKKASFREAFQKRRCLILANGFYEWQKTESGKVPIFFHLPKMPLFAMAGLWERWRSKHREHEVLSTCTILTTEANEYIRPVHDRMPVIVSPEHWPAWLNNQSFDERKLRSLLQPFPTASFASYPVSKQMNRVSYNNPSCIEPSLPAKAPQNLDLFS